MSGTRWVLVDDADRRIEYAGGWRTVAEDFVGNGNSGPTFRRSQHALTGGIGSLSFKFIGQPIAAQKIFGSSSGTDATLGTRIRLLGSSAVSNVSGTVDPRWECFVDGISIGSEPPFATHQNNWPLCVAPTLEDGEHTLTLNATSSGPGTFYFDQIKYLPSARPDSRPENVTVIVEQTDPTVIYDKLDEWKDVNGSARSTTVVGASMSVNFIGTKLAWVGWLLEGSSSDSGGSFSVDSQPSRSFIILGPTGPGSHFFQQIFETDRLPQGPHTVSVTYRGPNSTALALDHFLIENGDILFPGTEPQQDEPEPTVLVTPSPSPKVEASKGAPIPIGAIVGGAVGGVALICLFITALIFIRRRTRLNLPPIPFPSFRQGRDLGPRYARQSFSEAMVRKPSTSSRSARTTNSSDYPSTVNSVPSGYVPIYPYSATDYPNIPLEEEKVSAPTPPVTTRLTPLRRHMVVPNTIPE